MIPDYLIYDELQRRNEREWEPEPLQLPLYAPEMGEERDDDSEVEESPSRGVIIIDMNTGGEVSE